MVTFALWLALAAEPQTVRLAAPGFTVAGLDRAVAEGLEERFVQQLSRDGAVKVTSARDIAQVLGLERQKQLLGCAKEQTSCLTELAGALGVDGMLIGSLVKADESWVVTVRVIAARDGATLVSGSTRAASLDAVQDWLDAEAAAIADKLLGRRAHVTARSRAPSWILLGASAVVAATGGVLLGLAHANAGQLADDTRLLSAGDVMRLASDGRAFEASGYVLLGLGGAGVLASVLWLALGRESSGSVSVAVAPGAAAISWRATW